MASGLGSTWVQLEMEAARVDRNQNEKDRHHLRAISKPPRIAEAPGTRGRRVGGVPSLEMVDVEFPGCRLWEVTGEDARQGHCGAKVGVAATPC